MLNHSKKITYPPYKNNSEYLKDCIAFVDLLLDKSTEGSYSRNGKDNAFAELQPIWLEIRGRGKKSLEKGISIGFEKIAQKYRLDEIEAQILMVLAITVMCCKDDYSAMKCIKSKLSLLNGNNELFLINYLGQDSKLAAKRLITAESCRIRGFSSDLEITQWALDKIMAKKTKRRQRACSAINSPKTLYSRLNDYVVGQDNAKKAVSSTVFRHQQVCRLNKRRKGMDKIQKSNIMLIGATGTGKTHLCRTLANVLKAPITICDATQYTETGYVGQNVEDMLVALYDRAGKDLSLMERGIIYIDEIDKIAGRDVGYSHVSKKDVSGASVQQELLKLLDGEKIKYADQRGFSRESYEFDVSDIMFVAGGAFAGLEDIIKERLASRQIGFSAQNGKNKNQDETYLKHVTTEDLTAYGFIPEFIGRFSSIIVMDTLTKKDLKRILTEPKNSLLSQYMEIFRASNIDLNLPQGVLDWIAEQAWVKNTGARGLKSVLESCLSPILYEQARNSAKTGANETVQKVIFTPKNLLSA